MNYAFPTYTKFEFCITGPCFRGKTILFDFLLAILCCRRQSYCEPTPDDVRPPAGHDGEVQQGRQPGSAHARPTGVFAATLGVTMGVSHPVSPAPHPSIRSNQ